MTKENIIQCDISGVAYSITNKIYVDVREYLNIEYVVLNLKVFNFKLSVGGCFQKIIDCTFDEFTGRYELTPKNKLNNAEWVVVSLFDNEEISQIIKVNDKLYQGVSPQIMVEK